MDILEEGFEDATAVLELPEQYRQETAYYKWIRAVK